MIAKPSTPSVQTYGEPPIGLYTGVDGLAIKYTVCHTLFLHES